MALLQLGSSCWRCCSCPAAGNDRRHPLNYSAWLETAAQSKLRSLADGVCASTRVLSIILSCAGNVLDGTREVEKLVWRATTKSCCLEPHGKYLSLFVWLGLLQSSNIFDLFHKIFGGTDGRELFFGVPPIAQNHQRPFAPHVTPSSWLMSIKRVWAAFGLRLCFSRTLTPDRSAEISGTCKLFIVTNHYVFAAQ